MLRYVVLHDFVVTMGIYADVRIMREAEFHDAAKNTVSLRVAGNAMDDMIRLRIIYPLTFIDLGISRFWGWQESKVANDLTIIFNHKAAVLFHISSNDCLRGIAFSPLVHIARLPHYLLALWAKILTFGRMSELTLLSLN